ncbi:MAG: hypothetical protein JSS27_01065 [Planctomycetes bacterium]|nr:hypothetical protein [Planctomycetota bacterium]
MTTKNADPTVAAKVQRQADSLVIASGGTLALDAGATYIRGGTPQTASISTAAGASNVSLNTVQLKDGNGDNLTARRVVDIYLADDSHGDTITATTASGAVAAGASGNVLAALVASKMLRVITDATGKFILSITDTAKTHFYIVVALPDGTPIASAQLADASYGA